MNAGVGFVFDPAIGLRKPCVIVRLEALDRQGFEKVVD